MKKKDKLKRIKKEYIKTKNSQWNYCGKWGICYKECRSRKLENILLEKEESSLNIKGTDLKGTSV